MLRILVTDDEDSIQKLNEQRKYGRFPVAFSASFSDGVSVLAGTVMDIPVRGAEFGQPVPCRARNTSRSRSSWKNRLSD